MSKKELVIFAIVFLSVVGVYTGLAFWARFERDRDENKQLELYRQSFLQIVNETDHDTNVTMYSHEGGTVSVERYHIPPHHLVRFKEDIEVGELGVYFRSHPVDSALLVFDDTISFWQTPTHADMFNKHCLYREFDSWEHTRMTIREERQNPKNYRIGLYRYGLQYVISDRDYESAMGIKRYNGLIINENRLNK